ncbi:hypothetical protein [Agromyces lapidis]|uniref:AbiEi antitoxin C-terminal domain-containing protein n=1 Tax=Agromyces lapidis TaxID=279574 RepID=A0ABV5STP3_9MICO|nr:hypothetical protein [Agromyces lapidis]
MARLPQVLGTDDLPLAELCAARIDGELFVIDEGWAPVDEPELPSTRAAAAALRVPRRLIIERLSAAWVHGALDVPPRTAQFCVPLHDRVAVVSSPRTSVREVVIDSGDVLELGGARCTTPSRTAFDLLRDATLDDSFAELVVSRLLEAHAGSGDALRARLATAHRLPHLALARARFERTRPAGVAVDAARQAVASGPGSGSDSGSDQPSLTR